MLPEAALAVLRSYKQRMTSDPHEIVWSVPHEAVAEVIEAQNSLDGQDHAKWAAEHLVQMLKRNRQDVGANLIVAKPWVLKILRRRYLVQKEFVDEAYQHALELTERR